MGSHGTDGNIPSGRFWEAIQADSHFQLEVDTCVASQGLGEQKGTAYNGM